MVAACSTSAGVVGREANISRSELPTTATVDPAAVSIDGSTPVVEPSAAGLPPLDEPDPAIVVGELANGLRYLIRENGNPGGSVEMRLVVDAGSALQAADQVGGAHFLEHMLFNGTAQFPENELIAVLRRFGAGLGADVNASTSYDETVYELSMPTDDPDVVDTGLVVLEQWLSAATLDPAAVEAERGVVLDEWRTSEQSPDGRVFDAIEELFLAGSPYEGQDPIGTADAISATVPGPLRRFYDDWYRPDNAAVIVVGDIDARTIERGIIDRFGPAVSRGPAPERRELTMSPAGEPRARVVADPDIAGGFALVNLPRPAVRSGTPQEVLQRTVLDDLAFSMIATRLSTAALRGETAFDGASVDSNSIVRGLDAPEIVVDADGAAMQASVQAILDEYERVRRFGFTAAEVARAVGSRRSLEESYYAGRGSRQDSAYAEEYVDHVLEGTSIATDDSRFELVTAVLDGATPETVAYRFVTRLAATGPHILVVVPEDEAADVPEPAAFEEMARTVGARRLLPVGDEDAAIGALMAAPAPVEERSRELLADGGEVSFVRPLLLTFGNGVRVALNPTDIVEGNVALHAASVGGLAAVDLADVPDADAAGTVVAASGLGGFDTVELEAFLADKDVALDAYLEQFTEHLDGFASTVDLEVLFQLVHLQMTEARADDVAVDRYVDDELPYASDPSLDPLTAEFRALLDARYDDPRYLLPTVESLETVDREGIERVMRDRYGDAGDWVFALSGDLDLDEAIELSRRYLGTLPATGRVEATDYVEPPPPEGIVVEQVNAGEGQTASLSLLFTAPASNDRRDDVAARVLEEVVTARLTDSIREELGESYSPFAVVQLTGGATPNAETYLSVSTAPDRVGVVSAAVSEQLTDLITVGPTAVEYEAAIEKVRRDLNLFTNQSINDEVLAVLIDPAGNASFDDYLGEVFLVEEISAGDVRSYLDGWLPLDRYIEVRVVPR